MRRTGQFWCFLLGMGLLWNGGIVSPPAFSQDDAVEERPQPTQEKSRGGSKRVPANVVIGQVLETDNGIQLYAPRSLDMRFGMKFFANQNRISGILATIPFPMDWPEQKVTIIESNIPDSMRWEFRDLPAGARQLVMQMQGMGPGDQLDLVFKVNIEKSFINAPEDVSGFRRPKTIHRELQWYLGSSPYIDVSLSEIRRTAKAIADSEPENVWAQVELLYDWVRDNIVYYNGPVRHIKDALKDKKGDCEEMTGIFVALCRASGIPARCVWIPEHCYPEFYLEDENGKGHWFPCQVAGERQFGQMHDYRPILQKGDRFKVPEERGTQRYLATFFKCSARPVGGGGKDVAIEEVLDLGQLTEELERFRQEAATGASVEAP